MQRLSLVEIIVTVAAAALVTVGDASDQVSCPAFPACLTGQSTAIAFVHQGAAGALLLMSVAIVLLALPLRNHSPSILRPAVLALVVLVVTAGFGMLFASGVLPLADAPIQFVFLAAVVGLFAWTARNAMRAARGVTMGIVSSGVGGPPRVT